MADSNVLLERNKGQIVLTLRPEDLVELFNGRTIEYKGFKLPFYKLDIKLKREPMTN